MADSELWRQIMSHYPNYYLYLETISQHLSRKSLLLNLWNNVAITYLKSCRNILFRDTFSFLIKILRDNNSNMICTFDTMVVL